MQTNRNPFPVGIGHLRQVPAGADHYTAGDSPVNAPGMAQGHYPLPGPQVPGLAKLNSGQPGGVYGQGRHVAMRVIGQDARRTDSMVGQDNLRGAASYDMGVGDDEAFWVPDSAGAAAPSAIADFHQTKTG